MFGTVNTLGVDVYVTSDLRHHPATDELQQSAYEAAMRAQGVMLGIGDAQLRPALINTPHSAIESLWFRYALEDVPTRWKWPPVNARRCGGTRRTRIHGRCQLART